MRILHISAYYYPDVLGGAEAHLQQLCERLAERGHEIVVFAVSGGTSYKSSSSSQRPRDACEAINRVKVRRFWPEGVLRRGLNSFLKLRGAYRLLRCFVSPEYIELLSSGRLNIMAIAAAVRFRAEIVVVHNWCHPAVGYYGSLIKGLTRAPYVGIPLLHTEEAWSHSPALHALLGKCDTLLTNTDHEKRFIEARVRGRRSVCVVPPGVDAGAFSHRDGSGIRRRLGIGKAPLVGYVGRMQPTKGVVKLIEAMQIVWRSDPSVRLLLAGRRFPASTEHDREFQHALASLSAGETSRVIHLDGFADNEKSSIFEAIDIFAMPSTAESFGIAYLEAWMCQKPVVASRIGSTRCVVDDGVDGVLVDPKDSGEIAGAILDLLRQPQRAVKMGRAGYEKTRARFTWDIVTDQVERTYQELIGTSPR